MEWVGLVGVLGVFAAILLVAVVVGLVFGVFLLLPLLWRGRIKRWTEGRSAAEAWATLERGATRGAFQFFPASFLYDTEILTTLPSPQALHVVAEQFSGGWGRSVLHRDAQGVVVSYRFLPWIAADMGWIGAVIASAEPHGTRLRLRFRTTYMLPVITFFLTIRLKMYTLRTMDVALSRS